MQPDAPVNSLQVLLRQVEELGRENAALRLKLELTPSERLLQETLSKDIQQFVEGSVKEVSAFGNVPAEVEHAHNALTEMCTQNLRLEEKISALEREIVPALREERDMLHQRCVELALENEKLTASESVQNKILSKKLEDATQIEIQLRSELTQLSQSYALSTVFVKNRLESIGCGLRDANTLKAESASLQHVVTSLQNQINQLHEGHRLELQNLLADHSINLQTINETHLELSTSFDEIKAQMLFYVDKNHELVKQIDTLKRQLEDKTREDEKFDLPGFQELKRRRLEIDQVSARPETIRHELIQFWYDGHERIEKLEEVCKSNGGLKTALAEALERVAELERGRGACVDSVAALTKEVQRLREEVIQLRSDTFGLNAENNALVTHLTKSMSNEETNETMNACMQLREKASHFAQLNAQAVADPKAIEAALRQAQELKHEISELVKQKEQLLNIIGMREQRLESLKRTETSILGGVPQVDRDVVATTICDEEGSSSPSSSMIDPFFARETNTHIHQLEQAVCEARLVRCAHESFLEDMLKVVDGITEVAICFADLASRQVCLIDSVANRQVEATKRIAVLEDRKDNEGTPHADSIDAITTLLKRQLACIQDAVESESRQHAVAETKYVQALLTELQTEQAFFSSSKRRFEELIKHHPSQLVQRFASVSGVWTAAMEARSNQQSAKFNSPKDTPIVEAILKIMQKESVAVPLLSEIPSSHLVF